MADWITRVMQSMSYWGIALLMLLENVFPPLPSEIVMPAAGFAAREGEMALWGVIVAGSIGSLAGVTPWYILARSLGQERLRRWADRHGKWLTISSDEIDRANEVFERWGIWAVLLGRLIPGLRTLISVPAGFGQMPLLTFLIASAIGTAAWTTLLAVIGWYLRENYETVQNYITPIATTVLAGLAAWFAVWVWQRKRRQARK